MYTLYILYLLYDIRSNSLGFFATSHGVILLEMLLIVDDVVDLPGALMKRCGKPRVFSNRNMVETHGFPWIHNGASRFSTSTSVYGRVPTVPHSKFTDFLACELTP